MPPLPRGEAHPGPELSNRSSSPECSCAQECDLLQGFHVFVDTDTAWGGVAVELLEYLRDDYRTTPIVTFATAERGGFPTTPDPAAAAAPAGGSARRRPLNAALSAAGLADYSSLVVPVDSAAFAAALERFYTDRYAATTNASRASWLNTWLTMHAAAYAKVRPPPPAFPLSHRALWLLHRARDGHRVDGLPKRLRRP